MKNLLVLDGNSIINRAFYGIRDLSTSSGIPTNAVYGFINIVNRYLDMLSPEYLVCAFDTRSPTFRHEQYDMYKSNRHGMPDELAAQMPYAKRAAEGLGFTILECPGYEADDIIGTVCRAANDGGDIKSYILTGDRDSLQLINDATSVILMRNREDELFDKNRFIEVYGISPDQFVDVKALMGDSSDCIPGVRGIGEKTALKLISAAGSLDNLYENAESGYFGSGKALCTKLNDGKDSAFMSRSLARICTEAPVGGDIRSYKSKAMDKGSLYSLFHELEFGGFIKKFKLSPSNVLESSESTEESNKYASLNTQNITSVELMKITIKDGVSVAYDGDSICIVSDDSLFICGKPEKSALDHIFSNSISVCTHDYKKLCVALKEFDITPKCAIDTMLALYLLSPGKNTYAIENLAEHIGAEYSGDLESEAAIVAQSSDILKKELKEIGMYDLLKSIEIPLASTLADMEYRGFKVNADGIRNYSKALRDTEEKLAASIYSMAGHDFNINSPKQLGAVLFDELGLRGGKKTKTGYSTDADTLSRLVYAHPIISEILSYRQIAKLRGTYGDALADMADKNGRIHTKLNQCGTATGRLSSSDPNLQNIPVRGELGRELRKYFIAENDDYVLIDADYSQIELRLLAHLSGDRAMIDAFNSGEDIHTTTASHVFGVDPSEITKEQRTRAKAVNFGIVYGIGAFSLAQDIGTSKKEAEEYIREYFSAYPEVDRYLKETVENAETDGFTHTMFGRVRRIPEIKSSNKNVAAFGRRVAMNSPIQGSAADIIKIAMINVSNALEESGLDARLIMQVHDELIVEASVDCKEKAKEILLREMESAVSLSVPLTAEAGIGGSWYEAK